MNPLLSLDSSSTKSDVFVWSAHQKKVVRPGTILRQSSNQRNHHEQWQGRQLLSPPLPRSNHRLSQFDSASNEPLFTYGFGSQHPIVPPSLNDLNLPPNPFNVLAAVAVVRADKEYSRQAPESSIPSPISTPSMN